MGYNGWTNYATWLVNLHLSNDESWDEQYQACRTVADLKDLVDGIINGGDFWPQPDGLLGDLVAATVSDVNYYELFDHIEQPADLEHCEECDEPIEDEDKDDQFLEHGRTLCADCADEERTEKGEPASW